MSRAFIKEDAESAPPLVPSRPPLPPGVPNYVTPRGLGLLRAELEALGAEQRRLEGVGERTQVLALATRRGDLDARLASAELVQRTGPAPSDVRFGATVHVRDEADRERHYQIVGVDEADAARGLIAFFTPLARALLGRSVGDAVVVRTPRGEETLEIVAIAYG